MAADEWEHGEIVIPSQEWVDLKEKVRGAFNDEQERRHRLAVTAYGMILQTKQKKDGYSWKDVAREVLHNLDLEEGVRRAVHRSMFRNGSNKRPLKPRKMDFPLANNRTTSFDVDGRATITFDNDTRTAIWRVQERQHAGESAREPAVARGFFEKLEAIGRKNAWTPQSGGQVRAREEGEPGEERVLVRYGTAANRESTARYGGQSRR